MDDLLEEVISIDNDEERYCEYIIQPWTTDEQIIRIANEMKEYQKFISGIFDGAVEDKICRPRGYLG